MAKKQWVTEPSESLLRFEEGAEGVAGETPLTVGQVLKKTVEVHGPKTALNFKAQGQAAWTKLSWSEYYAECVAFAKALVAEVQLAPHRCTNILGFNSKEWFVANLGTILAGGVSAGIYTTNLPEACRYISDHSQAEAVIVEGMAQLMKYVEIASTLKDLKCIIVWGDLGDVPIPACSVPIYTYAAFLELGKDVADSVIEGRIADQQAGDCCTLIYTSGTTGPPKAVMISHDNITWTTNVLLSDFPFDSSDRVISYLPLSHIAAQILDIHGPTQLGCQVYFAQPDALKGSLAGTLKEVEPTLFFGVPRVWEKIYDKMQSIGKQTTGAKKSIATWAKQKGAERSRMLQYGGGGGAPCGYGIANKIVFSAVKANLGLGKTKCCFTAAAPIAPEILHYFASLDIAIYEVFGQSECTGPHTVNTPAAYRLGTVGRPLKGTRSKIADDTKELCYTGRHIFMGYMHDAEKTAETIDSEGWLHSGDVAEFNGEDDPLVPPPSGFMSITGRIKELIITAGGENVPPVLIENDFKRELPCLANCMVIGDKRKFLSILLTLKVEIHEDGSPSNQLTGEALTTSRAIGSSATTVEAAKTCEKWTAHIEENKVKINKAATSRAQVIQKWAIIDHDFTEKGGELTPTLKLKRGPTSIKHSAVIESLYAEAGATA